MDYARNITRYDLPNSPPGGAANFVDVFFVPDAYAQYNIFPPTGGLAVPDSNISINTRFAPANASDFHTIQIVNTDIPANYKMIVYWKGHDILPPPDSCGTIWKDMHNWRMGVYNTCEGEFRFEGAAQTPGDSADWYNNLTDFVLRRNQGRSPQNGLAGKTFNGPDAFNIVGNMEDDYASSAPRTAVYSLPAIIDPVNEFLPHDSTQMDYIVRFRVDHRLNIWKGDINNNMHRAMGGGIFTGSPYYDPEHLRNSIRFLVELPAAGCISGLDTTLYPVNPDFVRVIPNEIGYSGDTTSNTGGYYLGVNYVDSASILFPTGTNCGEDEIVAVFRLNSRCALLALSGMTMEVDLQPVCYPPTQAVCANLTYNDYVGQATIDAQVLFSPKRDCDADSADTDSLSAELSSCNDGCGQVPHSNTVTVPENVYPHACTYAPLTVQCPGCFLSGLYNEGFDIKRITYGLMDQDGNGFADTSLSQIVFNQKEFWPARDSTPNVRLFKPVANQVMYGDLFRVRVGSAVHLDKTYQPLSFSPSVAAFDSLLPYDAPRDKYGFNHCYLRINEITQRHSYYEAFGYSLNPDSATADNSIANVLVWFKGPLFDSIVANRPISIFWDHDANDWVDSYYDSLRPMAMNEYVFDLSMERIRSAYQSQYNDTFPYLLYEDSMLVDFDATFRLTENAKDLAPGGNTLEFESRAYFTIAAEHEGEVLEFWDMQNVPSLPGLTPPKQIFENQQALEDLPGYLADPVNYTFPYLDTLDSLYFPNVYLPTTLDSIRWWCVRGEGRITMIGHEHQFADFKENKVHELAYPYCGFNLWNRGYGIDLFRRFKLVNGGTDMDFPFEFRNPSSLHSIGADAPGAPAFSPAYIRVDQPASTFEEETAFAAPLFDNGVFHFGDIVLPPYSMLPPPLPRNVTRFYRIDDGTTEENEIEVKYEYANCGDSSGTAFCLALTETDSFSIFDLGHSAFVYGPHRYAGYFDTLRYGIDNQLADTLLCPGDSLPINDGIALTPSAPGTFSLPLLVAAPVLRSRTELFHMVKPGWADLTVGPISTPIIAQQEVTWAPNIINADTFGGMYAGQAPNAWLLLKLPTGWTPGTVYVNGDSLGHFLDFVDGGFSYRLYYTGTTGNNSVSWNSYYYNNGTLNPTPVQITLPYHCGDTLDAPCFMVGFSCDPSPFVDSTIVIDSVEQILSYSCGSSPFVPLPQNYQGPVLSYYPPVVLSPPGGDFLCEPSTVSSLIQNIGLGCLDGLQALANQPNPNSGFSIVGASYEVQPSPLLNYVAPFTLPDTFLLTHNANACPDGLGGAGGVNTGVLNIQVMKNCGLSYDPNDRLTIRVSGLLCPDGDTVDIEHFVNPYLDNPASTFNNFALSLRAPDTLNDGCALRDIYMDLQNLLVFGQPGAVSLGADTVGPNNVLVVSLPAGLVPQSGWLLHGGTPFDTLDIVANPLTDSINNAEVNTSFAGCGGGGNVLHYLRLPAHAPTDSLGLSLQLGLDGTGPACSTDFCAGLFTMLLVDCDTTADCEIVALQNPATGDSIVRDTLHIILPVPTLDTLAYCGHTTVTVSGSCAVWMAVDTVVQPGLTADVLSGTHTVWAYSGLDTGAVCVFWDSIVIDIDSMMVEILGDTIICDSSSIVLTATGGGTYLWNTGDSTAVITVTEAGVYSVTSVNAAGCTDSASITVNLSVPPIVTISGFNVVCTGQTVTLTANGAATYVWSTGSVTQSTTVNAQGGYSVTGTNIFGCTASDDFAVFDSPTPPPVLSISGPAQLCQGALTTLTVSGASEYIWSNGADTISISVGVGAYTVTGTSDIGCTATASFTVALNTCCDGNNYVVVGSGAFPPIYDLGQAINGGYLLPRAAAHDSSQHVYVEGYFEIRPFYTNIGIDSQYRFFQSEIVMGTGAEMKIIDTFRLDIDSSNVHGCTHFWKSITVSYSSVLGANSTTFRHGEHAIKAESLSRIYIRNDTFTNNYAGIYLPAPTGAAPFSVVYHDPIKGCVFNYDPSAPALLAYTGQSAGNVLAARRGIALYHVTNFDIGASGSLNTFQYLKYGIFANRVLMLNVSNSRFRDDIWGIQVDGETADCELNVTGLGVTSQPTFSYAFNPSDPTWDSESGVRVIQDCAVNFSHCLVQGCTNGVRVTNTTGYNHNISNNRFFCKARGVAVEDPGTAPIQCLISHNYIEMQGGTSARGIYISNSPDSNITNVNVVGNNIRMLTSGGLGIYGLDTDDLLIENDTVEQTHKNGGHAIYLLRCDSARVLSNRVSYTGPAFTGPGPFNASMASYRFWDCDNGSLIECNVSGGTRIGYSFGGGGNQGAIFRGNDIGSHRTGLQHSDGFIGPQLNHGNKWLDSIYTFSATGMGSSHTLFNFDVQNYNPFQPIFRGTVTGPAIVTAWFDSTAVDPVNYCEEYGPGDEEDGLLSSMQEMLVATDPELPKYSENINWTADKNIFEKLDGAKDSVELTFLEEAFYEAKSLEPMGQLVQIKTEAHAATKPSPQDSGQLAALKEEISGTRNQLIDLEFQLGTALDMIDSLQIQQEKDSLVSYLAEIGGAINTLTEQVLSASEEQVNEVKMRNAQIATFEVYEENQRTVNDISLSTIAKKNYVLNEEQRDAIYAIAWQCPLAGGEAVYEARFLYELMEAPLAIDDDSICEVANLLLRESDFSAEEEGNISVFPNPASKALYVTFDDPLETGCRLLLVNQLGVTVLDSRIPANLHSAFVVLSGIETGVYAIQIFDQEGYIQYRDKVIVIR